MKKNDETEESNPNPKTKQDETQLILSNINKLPKELISTIFEYIRPVALVSLNRSYYALYHPSIKHYLCNIKHQYDNYVRDIIRRDSSFVFSQVLQENYRHWLHFHNYYYKEKMYINYLYFLIDYCLVYDSNKCRQLIQSTLYGSNVVSKNQHKKNLVKIIKRKWMN
jgi:hypothetical protein